MLSTNRHGRAALAALAGLGILFGGGLLTVAGAGGADLASCGPRSADRHLPPRYDHAPPRRHHHHRPRYVGTLTIDGCAVAIPGYRTNSSIVRAFRERGYRAKIAKRHGRYWVRVFGCPHVDWRSKGCRGRVVHGHGYVDVIVAYR